MFCIKNSLYRSSINPRVAVIFLLRHKSKKAKVSVCTKALKHFDDFYKSIFLRHWPSVRLALLSREKYVAVVNNFGDIEETEQKLLNAGALNFKSYLEIQKKHVDEEKPKNSFGDDKIINSVISSKWLEEHEKELGYDYRGEESGNRVSVMEEEEAEGRRVRKSEDDEEFKEHEYDIDSAVSSLHADLIRAEIEQERLILPDNSSKATLSDFVPATKLRDLDSFIPESEYYKYYKKCSAIEVSVDPEFVLDFPEDLRVYTFDRGEVSELPKPTICINDVYDYLPVDGAELLAVLVLGVETGDRVLNMSSVSGRMGYCLFQSLRAQHLTCSDSEEFKNIFKRHLYDYNLTWRDMLLLTDKRYFCNTEPMNLFDKILVEVPSTNDRESLYNEEDNMFSAGKTKQRIKLPGYQSRILTNALNLLRPGGAVVYTTSTLSPVQNESVVSDALLLAMEERKALFTVKDLSPALAHTKIFYNFGEYLNLKYGTLVVPFVPSNFGPRYICKIVKNE